MKKFLSLSIALAMVLGLAACGGDGTADSQVTDVSTPDSVEDNNTDDNNDDGGDDNAAAGDGSIYFFNFKPEQDAAYQDIAKAYTDATGVPVKVTTAASGTYEQQLRSEITKSDAPTIFQVNGPVGYAAWADYCLDLSNSDIYGALTDDTLALKGSDGGVYGIPFAIEGYGIIVNTSILQTYLDMDGAKVDSIDDIKDFDTLKDVVEDMQSKKDDLGIDGVFASTSLAPGEDWRWQTHLSNVPFHFEWKDDNADLSNADDIAEIEFKYNENYKNIFDLYLNNSTVEATLAGSKSVDDSMAEFALGQAAMVQNGNWAYSQISDVSGNVVGEGDVQYLPIYMGIEDDNMGLCIGTENYFAINSQASEENQKASLDFMNWLYTSDEGKDFVINQLGFIAPFTSFGDDEKPADPLGAQIVEWNTNSAVENVPWDFTIYPSQTFKDNFGGYLLQYAQGNMDWDDVVDNVKTDWANEMQATASMS